MLTRAQFDSACKTLIAKYSSSLTVDTQITAGLKGWTWTEHPSKAAFGFMSRETIHSWKTNVYTALDNMPVSNHTEEQLAEEEDDLASAFDSNDTGEILIAQQYVVYSATFQVPSFYFTIHDSNGVPLPLSKLVRMSPLRPFAFERSDLSLFGVTPAGSSFPLLSQGEHPTLGTPCWYLHPCQTRESVDELMGEVDDAGWTDEEKSVRWLEMWFTVVGTVVNVGGR